MPPRHRARAIAAAALLLALAGTAAAVVTLMGGAERAPGAAAIDRYLAAWTRGDDRAAAALTDAPAKASRGLRADRRGLDGASVRATVLSHRTDGPSTTARVRVRWDVPRFGPFQYTVRVAAAEQAKAWRVRWSDRNVHPRLGAGTRLGTTVEWPRRAPILDRGGRRLITDRPVVDVAVKVSKGLDPGATAGALAALLDVGAPALERRIATAPSGRFVPVLTVRRAEFEPLEERLAQIPGVSFNRTTAQLAPTRSFGRAVLGSVGAATAEQVARSRGRLADGDRAGQSGLEQAHDERLSGSPERRVVIRDQVTGEASGTLQRRAGRRPRPLRTLLDRDVQTAAERALGDSEKAAALVVVEPSSGDVLAVANRPGDSTYDRALLGRYPPGSTFKVVTTAALLRAGLRTDETVGCPATLAVDGKPFRNFEGSARGAVPFREDFAQSCNTAFVSLARRLGRDALTEAARGFGMGERLAPGVPAAGAEVPAPRDALGQAAMMIGQDRILASPLAMASVSATVAAGRWRAPRLLPDAARSAGPPVDRGTISTLRELMRDVVTGGTGTALAGIPGDVLGKSGTAEYGGGDPPPTHAWFIAARGDLALSVLVEGGSSGGEVAAPLARRFFEAHG